MTRQGSGDTGRGTGSPSVSEEWVLPAAIPFADLKGRDLEECVYWLLDAMGAKDLEWRTGGSGGGAADGGRDLEAIFYAPTADGELDAQKWWIECKGRGGTVEADEVKAAVNNAAMMHDLDFIVVATNTQFSNPTRDWIRQWQSTRPKPKIKLWDHTQLERYLSRHPDVVLRLFSQALSPAGRFKAMESRFWNKLEFVTPKTLGDLWEKRSEIELTAMGVFAAIANEFTHRSITTRPWATELDAQSLLAVLSIALQNVFYLVVRCEAAGVEQEIFIRSLAYLILAALHLLPAEIITHLVIDSLARGERDKMPEDVQDMLLTPIIGQLQSELQDVCSSDCKRVRCFDRKVLSRGSDELENYWMRLEPEGLKEPADQRFIRIENHHEPCLVGFQVDKEHSCPLFGLEPSVGTAGELLDVLQRVSAFRSSQAAEERRVKSEAAEKRRIENEAAVEQKRYRPSGRARPRKAK